MQAARKKDLVREYKERKISAGIIGVRCLADGALWVAASRDVAAQKNGIWFQLRMGNHMNKALQAAWDAQGETQFAYEVLEVVADDNPEMLGLVLKEREAHWAKDAARLFA